MARERLDDPRTRATSFGSSVEAYDRYRSGYPDAAVADVVAPGAVSALDVACGTGKLALALAQRGLQVLGVEPDEQMAAVARGHGLAVETAAFETWDARGRRFDLLTCAQAWHWLDPVVALPQAAAVLRPGGSLVLLWNYHVVPDDVLAAFGEVYRDHAPELPVLGAEPTGPREVDPLGASFLFTDVATRTYRWERRFEDEEWTGMLGTFSDHRALGAERLRSLQDAVQEVLDRSGDALVVRGGTYVRSARRRSWP